MCGKVLTLKAQSDSTIQLATHANLRAYELLNVPDLKKEQPNCLLKVAVIDGGFNLNHRGIQQYIYINPHEIPGNEKDDDLNGFVDDISGWDIADEDNNVFIPEGRESFFYQGTMISGAITQIAERCFGDKASTYIKILPVKAIGNQALNLTYERGFAGIEYAVRSNADIIVCAWSIGKYDQEKYGHIFEEANKKGILIMAAAGDSYIDQCELPSSIGTVYAVSALDSNFRKLKSSNYGKKVDLSAPGEFVYAPHPAKDNTYSYNDGTAAAVSLAAGCAAILKVMKPVARPVDIMRALKNTCTPIDSLNISYTGKLGSGFLNLSKAVRYLLVDSVKDRFFNPRLPEGEIIIEKKSKKNNWEIEPFGGMQACYFSIKGSWEDNKTPIKFFSNDTLIRAYTPMQFPINTIINGSKVKVVYDGKRGKSPCSILYEAVMIDSAKLFCNDALYYQQTKGELSDGSGAMNYSNNCECKWLITVPQGKRIKIVFDEFNTQAKIDYVSLFDGSFSIPENILSAFSGPDLPPIIISRTNQVLIWFVTDSSISASGWHLNYEATDEESGVKSPLQNKK